MSGIILTADLHLGMTTHDGPDADGSPSWRRNEAERVCAFIGSEAKERDANLILAGDTYTSTRPQTWAYLAAEEIEPRCVIPGNHDWPVGEGVLSPLMVAPGCDCVVGTPRVEFGADRALDVAFIPWFGRAFVAAKYPDLAVGDQNRYMAEALERIVADLASQKREGVPLVVVTHFTIGGATWNSGVQPSVGESNDFMVPSSVFDDARIDHVFSGHIHKPQTFGKITYIGSPVRSDFGEEGQPTRILHLTNVHGAVHVAEIETPSVEFVSVDYPRNLGVEDFEGKVVRIVGEAPSGEGTAAALAALTTHIYECGALHVAKPAVKFTRHEARAIRAIATDATPADALRTYADMVGGEYTSRLDALLALQASLLEGGAL